MTSELFETARLTYRQDRDKYSSFVQEVIRNLRISASKQGLSCQVEGRAKEVGSFIKKAIRKRMENPLEEVKDKAGVRIILLHEGDRQVARRVVESCYPKIVWQSEAWTKAPQPDLLQYPNYHLQIRDEEACERLGIIAECEIQIRSEAAHLWSRLSHRFLYKAGKEPPGNVARALLRLLALVEIYDSEVQRAVSSISADPEFHIASILNRAEDEYLSFCTSSSSPELSLDVAAVLVGSVSHDQVALYPHELTSFIEENRLRLTKIFAEYGPNSAAGKAGMFIMLGQPESILFFERIANARLMLEECWEESEFPGDLLKEMVSIWG